MADDPPDRDRRKSNPLGTPIVRPATERGEVRPSEARHVRVEKIPPGHVRTALGHDRTPAFMHEDITARYDGEELKKKRAGRSTEERFEILEEKSDKQGDRIGKLEVAVADFGGQFKIIPDLVDAMKDATKTLQSRDHLIVTTRTEIDKAQELGDVAVKTAEKVGNVEIKKDKWKLLLKLGAIVAAIWTTISTVLMAKGC